MAKRKVLQPHPSYERAPDPLGMSGVAFYHGVLRTGAGAVVWRCHHPGKLPHGSTQAALTCARAQQPFYLAGQEAYGDVAAH